MNDLLIRCSSLSCLMPDPTAYPRDEMSEEELAALKTTSAKRTPEQVALLDEVMARTLSEGAKSHVHDLVRRSIMKYVPPELGGKEIKKGRIQEKTAINLLNDVCGTMYEKNETRFNNEWLTGEPDIDDEGIEDIKCPWSKETFPLTEEMARKMAVKAGYDWQMRGYMMLRNKQYARVRYCLVDTPSELIPPWEADAPGLHDVSGIPLEHRVTTVTFMRDSALELRIRKKCESAQRYAKQIEQQFLKEHAG